MMAARSLGWLVAAILCGVALGMIWSAIYGAGA